MLLKDLYRMLSMGTLQSLYVGGQGSGEIPEEYIPALNNSINTALRKIFSTFPLKEGEVIVRLQEQTNMYYLRPEYRQYNEDSPIDRKHRYIEETPMNQFKNDVLRIDSIANKEGRIQYQNDPPIRTGIRLPEFDCIQVPLPRNGEFLFIKYSASHPEINEKSTPDTVINIPSSVEEMLMAYVGYLEYSVMTGERQTAKAHEYLNKYNYLVTEMYTNNLLNTGETGTNTLFSQRGFV